MISGPLSRNEFDRKKPMESAMICRGTCNKEPLLSELLEDPIVLLLMTRDGVKRCEVEALIEDLPTRPKNTENQMAGCACHVGEVQP